jgi:RNA polymerase sigma-70 factor, ECF subfamily
MEDAGGMPAADAELMARVAAGDEAAFRELVERHQAAVVGTVARMLGGGADAEDIAQEVFVRVWRSAPRYKPTAKFTTWLFTITRNLVFNESRRRSRAVLLPMEHGDGSPRDHEDERAPAPSANLALGELQDAIDAAMAALPEVQRLALVLRRHESMSYEDIAGVLGTSVPSVKSLLFRARGELRRRLASWLD